MEEDHEWPEKKGSEAAGGRGALARALGYGQAAQQQLLNMLLVKDVMTTDVATIGPDAPVKEAARTMRERKIGCLVVVEGRRLVGILTEADFVEAFARSS